MKDQQALRGLQLPLSAAWSCGACAEEKLSDMLTDRGDVVAAQKTDCKRGNGGGKEKVHPRETMEPCA